MACGQSTGGHVFKREVGGNPLRASPPCTPCPYDPTRSCGILTRFSSDNAAIVAIGIITAIVAVCVSVRNHYSKTRRQLKALDSTFESVAFGSVTNPPKPDQEKPTAVFLVGSSRGGGLHALLWVQRMFPHHFFNFVFINARTVDSQAYGGSEEMGTMKVEANSSLRYFDNFCNSKGWAAKSYLAFGTDPIDDFTKLCEKVHEDFPNAIYFTSKLIFEYDNWFTRLLHNEAALVLQRRLHLQGLQMIILPMKL